MANNLISEVMKLATPALIDRLSAAFGVNASTVSSVLSAAFPAIFASVAEKASTPSGLSSVMNALYQAKPDMADTLGTALAGGKSASMVSAGHKMLGALLGEGALSNLTNSITQSTGASAAAGSSLIAIAGQLAMSTLAKQATGLDGAGVASMLGAQRGAFQAELPSSLTNMVSAAGPSAGASTSSRPTAAPMSSATAPAKGGTNWLMWLIPLALIAAALWYFLGNKDMDDKMAPAASTTTTAPAVPATANIMIDNVDVTKTLGDSLTGLTGALGGITDAATAQTAVAKIQDAGKGIDTISGLAAKFTPEQKTAVAALVNAGLPALKDSATKVEAMAGVGDLVKPVLDGLLAKLDALTK